MIQVKRILQIQSRIRITIKSVRILHHIDIFGRPASSDVRNHSLLQHEPAPGETDEEGSAVVDVVGGRGVESWDGEEIGRGVRCRCEGEIVGYYVRRGGRGWEWFVGFWFGVGALVHCCCFVGLAASDGAVPGGLFGKGEGVGGLVDVGWEGSCGVAGERGEGGGEDWSATAAGVSPCVEKGDDEDEEQDC